MKAQIQILASLAAATLTLTGCSALRQFFTGSAPSPAEQVLSGQTAQEIQQHRHRSSMAKAETAAPAPEPKWDPSESTEKEAERFTTSLLDIARGRIGCRYAYASKGPKTFDCSGFTSYVYRQFGIELSPSSSLQSEQGRRLSADEPLKPGDLVFFSGRRVSKTVGHVGIVVSYNADTKEFTFIHAAVSTGVEMQKSTQQYYAARYLFASRILPDEEVIESDVKGRDLRRTFYTVGNNLSDGVGYDLMDTDDPDVRIMFFDNRTWTYMRSSEVAGKGDIRGIMDAAWLENSVRRHQQTK